MLTIDLTIKYLKAAVDAARHLIGWRRVSAELYLERVATNEFIRLERKFAYDLFMRLPQNGFYTVDELTNEVRVWAVEACYRYDPGYRENNTFATFLYSHLTLRCMQYRDKAWSTTRYPDGGRWLFTESGAPLQREDRVGNRGSQERGDASIDTTVAAPDPAKTPDVVATLTPETQEVIRRISADEALISLARSPHNRRRLSEKSGLANEAIERAFNEVRLRADRYEDLA